MDKETFDKGTRCKGICSMCQKKNGCYQYMMEAHLVAIKPPLGLTPREIWVAQRVQDIREAIQRYTEANMPIPQDWIEEYNDLVKGER